jgi:hypothetical protein
MLEEPEKNTPKVEQLENANTELFNSFNPEEELWVVGGSSEDTFTGRVTLQPDSPDMAEDLDYTW